MRKRNMVAGLINHVTANLKAYWFVGSMVAIYLIFSPKNSDEKGDSFDQAEIKGRIVLRDERKGIAQIKVHGDSVTYQFLAVDNDMYPEKFNRIVRVGDSIYKAPYADSIQLFQDGKRYSWKLGG